jgi:general secretion pathway protein G
VGTGPGVFIMNKHVRAFTLVEVLIVVVILGILASIVVPQFSSATTDSQKTAMADQVVKLRRVLSVYYVRNGNAWPSITAGDGTWGELSVAGAGYMRMPPPSNMWVGGTHAREIILRDTPDVGYHTNYGWIFDPATGNLWAAGFDGFDQPFPRP